MWCVNAALLVQATLCHGAVPPHAVSTNMHITMQVTMHGSYPSSSMPSQPQCSTAQVTVLNAPGTRMA